MREESILAMREEGEAEGRGLPAVLPKPTSAILNDHNYRFTCLKREPGLLR